MMASSRALMLLALIGLTGCAGTPATNFYLLSTSQRTTDGAEPQPIALGVGPVDMPEYLDRPQIVTRSGTGVVHLAEFDQWAEPLRVGVTRVLAEDLATALPTQSVAVFPWRGATRVDRQVMVRIPQFEAVGNEVVLHARWNIDDAKGTTLKTGETRVREPARGGYAEIVKAMNRALATLGEEITAAVKATR